MNKPQTTKGVLCALGACLIWGLTPIYFKEIKQVPPDVIVSHRVIWSVLFMILMLTVTCHWRQVLVVIKQPKTLLLLGITAFIIASNWLTYIWAVNNNHMLEASLGYFINPLMSVLFAILFLGERLRRIQWIAVGLAFTGVFVQLWQFGSVPGIGLYLATTFALYGMIRKKLDVDVQTGMLIETIWVFPVALVYLLFFTNTPTSNMLNNTPSLNLLLVTAGIITTVPLLFFTAAAPHLRLSTLGFFQYISPTLVFLLATLVYGEDIGSERLITFGFIWVALVLFTLDAFCAQRRLQK
ncbi:putative chloramphenicol resistance permease [Xenorhabdus bovienii str. kraussei Quebec]|uniref:Putative chloramphenicol resistance permease n=1 Tax=Xenorhabdus bovienii str. kraussei Quebec TaxID=1398203 RepID=A0A077PKY2_XENBV|nr:EamA family transporter RarD [Xenorhabdus bovienii]CDH21698.1 putative chloramphenicol resistance permease [Xenorhabdus bovienii str. kraussei Quebec]